MNFGEIDFYLVFDLFILLLIGMGPKIALVPFLDITADMDGETKKKVASTMVRAAVGTALILVVLGGFLMKLLHFSPGAASIAGGIVLLLIALNMLVSPGKEHSHDDAHGRTAMQLAIYPLAVPFLLNPAGIATLVIASGNIDSHSLRVPLSSALCFLSVPSTCSSSGTSTASPNTLTNPDW